MNLRRLSSVSLGHLAIDVLSSSVAMILTVLAVPFDLSNSQIGVGVMIYQLVGSLTQPFFGVLADQSNFDPLLAVWTPNIFFGFIALYLIRYARR